MRLPSLSLLLVVLIFTQNDAGRTGSCDELLSPEQDRGAVAKDSGINKSRIEVVNNKLPNSSAGKTMQYDAVILGQEKLTNGVKSFPEDWWEQFALIEEWLRSPNFLGYFSEEWPYIHVKFPSVQVSPWAQAYKSHGEGPMPMTMTCHFKEVGNVYNRLDVAWTATRRGRMTSMGVQGVYIIYDRGTEDVPEFWLKYQMNVEVGRLDKNTVKAFSEQGARTLKTALEDRVWIRKYEATPDDGMYAV